MKMGPAPLSPLFERPTAVRVKLTSPSTTQSMNKKQSEFVRMLQSHSPSKFIKRRRYQETPQIPSIISPLSEDSGPDGCGSAQAT